MRPKTKASDFNLKGVHYSVECQGRHCIIHNPVPHHMDQWPLHYREDRNIFERICPHGVGHPDPSQYDYWVETCREYESVHGCCEAGCCSE